MPVGHGMRGACLAAAWLRLRMCAEARAHAYACAHTCWACPSWLACLPPPRSCRSFCCCAARGAQCARAAPARAAPAPRSSPRPAAPACRQAVSWPLREPRCPWQVREQRMVEHSVEPAACCLLLLMMMLLLWAWAACCGPGRARGGGRVQGQAALQALCTAVRHTHETGTGPAARSARPYATAFVQQEQHSENTLSVPDSYNVLAWPHAAQWAEMSRGEGPGPPGGSGPPVVAPALRAQTEALVAAVCPAAPSERRRAGVAAYIGDLVAACFSPVPVQVFMFGSVPLKTYLPDGDIDMSIFTADASVASTWTGRLAQKLEQEQRNPHCPYRVLNVQVINAEVGMRGGHGQQARAWGRARSGARPSPSLPAPPACCTPHAGAAPPPPQDPPEHNQLRRAAGARCAAARVRTSHTRATTGSARRCSVHATHAGP